jgi:hypothetical protein
VGRESEIVNLHTDERLPVNLDDRTVSLSRDAEYLDAYRPLSASGASPATGTHNLEDTELLPVEEPLATGTLFLMIIFLMLTFGIWAIVYGLLLNR